MSFPLIWYLNTACPVSSQNQVGKGSHLAKPNANDANYLLHITSSMDTGSIVNRIPIRDYNEKNCPWLSDIEDKRAFVQAGPENHGKNSGVVCICDLSLQCERAAGKRGN